MHSYFKINYHIVFSTKNRIKCIDNEMLEKIRYFIKEKCDELNTGALFSKIRFWSVEPPLTLKPEAPSPTV